MNHPQVVGYTIQREVGKGGMGVVYRALRTGDGATVALKVLLPHMVNPISSRRFQREGQALKSIDHPNIVKVHEVGCRDGIHYLAMEFLEGSPLSRLMRTVGARMPISTAFGYARQVARALGVIHERGMTHRDLKPSNIIVGVDDTAKLLDFGLVQVEGLTMLTAEGNVVGTPAYMSPEQCKGEVLDHRTDIYSFGVLLYELFCGIPPFQSASIYDLLEMHRNTAPPNPRKIRRDLPADCEQLILQCLEKNPGDRPQSMQEICARLGDSAAEPVGGQQPVQAAIARTSTRLRGARVASIAALASILVAALWWYPHPVLAGLRARVAEAIAGPGTAEKTDLTSDVQARYQAIAAAAAAHQRGRECESAREFERAYKHFREAHLQCADNVEYVHALVRVAGRLGREQEILPLLAAYLETPGATDPGGLLESWLDENGGEE